MFIPNSSELVVFMSAFVGSCVGFLWYNSYPAQVFMGDTGSLSLGAIMQFVQYNKKRIINTYFLRCFFIESISVILQVSYFKYTKKIRNRRRIFLMSPPSSFSKKEFMKVKFQLDFG